MARRGGRDLTIDELARRTGMTVRNIRAHQSRGLLPPPEIRGRTGFYGPEHVGRIERIRELQDEGFNLEAIRRLLGQAGGAADEVVRFTRALREPFDEEAPEVRTMEELLEEWGEDASPELLQRAFDIGLMRPLGEDRVEVRSPRLAAAGRELIGLGVPPERTFETADALRRHAEGVAEIFVRLFLREVWEPFEEEGRPEDRWPEVRAALERLRPLAGDALHALFGIAMTEAVDRALGAELERLAGEEPAATVAE